ncbi:GAF domain-containing protein [Hamadaea tsunoensis]|uniref:GAF domain-containing protein n=1 Tax=Hamadaea tsunoensis TaxID=53368 RepID=UPI00040035A4|nr:GAF domain-containing protein [Hamadaea tsunoensis]
MQPAYLADAGADPRSRSREIAHAHEAFLAGVDGGALDIRPVVAQSWQRSFRAGVDPGRVPPITLTDEALDAYRAAHPLAQTLSVLRQVIGSVTDDGRHLMVVADAHGQLLWVEGQSSARATAERMNFVEGALWDEEHAGTNAPGTALALDEAVQIFATEHFAYQAQSWTCAAAPIHDPSTGALLGVVDVTGHDVVAHPHSLALMKAAALAAEAQLAFRYQAGLWRPALREPVRLDVLHRPEGVLHRDGREIRLSLRHTELLLLLRENPKGLTGEQLAEALYDESANPITLRVELNRLRRVVGDLVRSRPYQLTQEIEADYAGVAQALDAGDVRAAVEAYAGPLLPRSEAQAVIDLRDSLACRMRTAVLAHRAPEVVEAWATGAGRDDLEIWEHLLALSPRSVIAAVKVARLRAEYGLPPAPATQSVATFMQRRRT